MLLVSWNVAGWEATLRYIKSHYSSLDAFLSRHSIDLLCIQEVKISPHKMSADPAAAGAHTAGWDSFWSFPQGKRGFNGVATFARKGLTSSADAQPLGDRAIDGEGRCLVTHHGKLSIFNVYAHSTGDDPDGSKQLKKQLLFRLLRERMQALREAGQHVALCGDLNLAYRPHDVPWKQTSLPSSLCRALASTQPADEPSSSGAPPHLSPSSSPLPEASPLPLPAASAPPSTTASPFHLSTASTPRLPKVSSSTAAEVGEQRGALSRLREALGGSALPEELLRREKVPILELGKRLEYNIQFEGANVFHLLDARFFEQGKRLEHMSSSERDALLRDVALQYGQADSSRASIEWMRKLITEDECVAIIVPCIWVWKAELITRVWGPYAGALRAATAGGRWQPAPMRTGGGLPDAPMTTHDRQFVPAHTGMIYTAPHASDHIAVSLLLDDDAISGQPIKLSLDEPTKACSFRPQKSLASFFS
ncbi:MAG: hypothetical protein SGPRY_012691, partial [Prymnesium sp.]